MAQTLKDSFLDLERHRQLLEENIEKLWKSLRHWQLWEAEYEGLKEEILVAKPNPNQEQLSAICRDYEGELVTKKEVEDILGSRNAAQVVNMLDRRIDYVEQNVRTVLKQIEAAENKLAAATVISTPEVRNEEGLPLTEIIEELDEEGNVVSCRTSTPGSAKPQLLEVLKKAGVTNLPMDSTTAEPASSSEEKPVEASKQNATESKKAAAFAEDTKPSFEPEKSQAAKRLEGVMNTAKQQETKPSAPPVIPADESPEDAALRREMLQYGMSEVGAVVAELDLEDDSDWTDEQDYDETSTDDEDEFGRSRGRVVDEEIRQQMIKLEQRLGVRMMENIGKKASDYDVVREGIGRVTINGQETATASEDEPAAAAAESLRKDSSTTSFKKSVRFSEELDISPAPKPATAATPEARRKTAPVNDIVERTAPAQSSASPQQNKKVSRFKSARTAPPLEFSPAEDQTRTVPTGPEGTTLAPVVVEREIPQDSFPAEPDELDPHLLHQEVATEYHKMRNTMIHRQGGFMKEEESEIVPFTEEEGGPKKMSRFKAARLARN
jgi:unconventional prefoldin RPB5 interactor 1